MWQKKRRVPSIRVCGSEWRRIPSPLCVSVASSPSPSLVQWRNMASVLSLVSALSAVLCLLSLSVCVVSGRGRSRTRLRPVTKHAEFSSSSVLSSLDSEFSLDHYFSPFSPSSFSFSSIPESPRTLWNRRHKREVREIEWEADPVAESKQGLLFALSSTITDSSRREFSLNSTSAGHRLVNVDSQYGNVYLAAGQSLDYENDDMNPLIVTVDAILRTNPDGNCYIVVFMSNSFSI